jgi:hypothetical protein
MRSMVEGALSCTDRGSKSLSPPQSAFGRQLPKRGSNSPTGEAYFFAGAAAAGAAALAAGAGAGIGRVEPRVCR